MVLRRGGIRIAAGRKPQLLEVAGDRSSSMKLGELLAAASRLTWPRALSRRSLLSAAVSSNHGHWSEVDDKGKDDISSTFSLTESKK